MPKTKNIIGSIFLFAFATAMLSFGCTSDEVESQTSEIQSRMNSIRTELESGIVPPRQEPFAVRSFMPFRGDTWIGNAVAYGCYREGQAPGQQGPSDEELLEDLQIISKHWQLIRLYGADGDTRRILELIDAHDLPIKVVQGIWLSPEEGNPRERDANIRSVMLGIELTIRYPDIVLAVSVGNETQVFWSGHRMPADSLIRYIRIVRDHVTVPVTTADDYLYWNTPDSRTIAAEVDFVFTHIHPLWNGKTLDEAMDWVDQIYQDVQTLHSDRVIVIGETGWATDYNAEKTGPGEQGTLIKGKVGTEAQTTFLLEMDEWIESNQVTSFLFEAFDEPWKGGGENSPPHEIEKNWGVFHEDRTPKESFRQFLKRRNEASD